MLIVKKATSKKIFIFCLFILLSLIFFNKNIFLNPKGNFDANYIYPRTVLSSLRLSSFLWNPNILCGNPLLADGHNYHILSPFIILILFFQYLLKITNFVSFNFAYIIHFPLAGFFMYLYARSIGIEKAGAVMSGIIYSFSNFFLTDTTGVHKMDSMVWYALILSFIEKAFTEEKVNSYYIILAGIFYGIQFLSASIQYSYYFSLFLASYFFLKFFIKNSSPYSKKIRVFNFMLSFFVIIIIGVGIFAIQFFPTYELAKESARLYFKDFNTAYGYYYLDHSYLKGIILLNLKEFSEKSDVFIGIIPLLLVTLPFFYREKNKYYYFFLFVGFFFIVLCSRNFISKFLYNCLPYFNSFKNPLRAFLLFIFSLAILAGFGLGKIKSNFIKIFLIGIFLFQAYPVWKLKYNDKFLSKVEEFNSDIKRYSNINKLLNDVSASSLTYRIFLNPDYIYWPKYKFSTSFGRSDYILARYLEFTKASLYIDKLADRPYYAFLLYPNYIKLTNTKYIILVKESADEPNDDVAVEEREITKYFQGNPLFEKIYEDDIIRGYQFKDALPRSLFVTHALYLKDKQKILDLLKQPSFDPKTTAVLEEPLDKFNLPGQGVAGGTSK